jgi:putative membrane protein
MSEYNPYSRFEQTDLILRDVLAADRTVLANERTFLAYMRTALTLVVSGITFVKFLGNAYLEILGWLFIPLGIFTFVFGWRRYRKMHRRLAQIHLVQTGR